MTTQPLYQIVTGTVNSHGYLTLTFPAVPQGLVWTGSVSMFAPPTLTPGFNPTLDNGPLEGARWFLQRNLSPIVQMGGAATAYGVQLVGQEVLTVQGYGLTSGSTVTAVWSGFSDAAADAPIVSPQVYGSTPADVQVYTSAPGAPLAVTETIATGRAIGTASGFLTGAGSTAVMLAASSQANYKLLSIMLNVSTGISGSTAQSNPIGVQIQLNDGTNTTRLMQLEPVCIQSSTIFLSESLDLAQLPVAFNQDVEVTAGAFAGTGMILRVNAQVVYSYTPTAP